jgi:hypothetical protein
LPIRLRPKSASRRRNNYARGYTALEACQVRRRRPFPVKPITYFATCEFPLSACRALEPASDWLMTRGDPSRKICWYICWYKLLFSEVLLLFSITYARY